MGRYLSQRSRGLPPHLYRRTMRPRRWEAVRGATGAASSKASLSFQSGNEEGDEVLLEGGIKLVRQPHPILAAYREESWRWRRGRI